MSYDLMVFDPAAAPPDRPDFLAWYAKQTEWTESHGYNDPEVSSPALKSWFIEMIQSFPAMNGPYASSDMDDSKVTDYSVGKSVIYAAFAWSEAQNAYRTMFDLAAKHKVGFFDVSADDGEVWVPSADGSYACSHGRSLPGTPRIITIAKIATKEP